MFHARSEIYFNLHKRCFSVRQGGRVVAHVDSFTIRKPEFVVRQSGRNRVLATGRKNVHAFVRGELIPHTVPSTVRGFAPVTYNPHRASTFQWRKSGDALHSASYAAGMVQGGVPHVLARA